jgi:hypothetical protein
VASRRSSFRFPTKMNCFDPSASLLRAALLLVGLSVVLFLVPSSIYIAAGSLAAAVLCSLVLASRDRRRYACVSVALSECRLLEVEERPGLVQGVVLAGDGVIGGLRLRMRLASPEPVRSGMRRIPLVLSRKGAVVRWQDGGNDVLLETRDEVIGALGVVARGDQACVEVLYGSRPGEGTEVLAARFSSSEGAVQSWDAGILVGPGYGLLDRVLLRTRTEGRCEPAAKQDS